MAQVCEERPPAQVWIRDDEILCSLCGKPIKNGSHCAKVSFGVNTAGEFKDISQNYEYYHQGCWAKMGGVK